jgi:hypothetical protein
MSDNETDNLPLSKLRDIERYKNAERMARALRPYLPSQDDQTPSRSASRGRTKDKRICQLSAAFKYCTHLEKGLKDAYEKCGTLLGPLTDDYKLLSNSLLSNNNNNLINSTQNTNIENIVDYSTMNNTETQISINNSCFKLSDALDDEAENFYLSPNQNHQNNASIHESSTISATNGAANHINKKAINNNNNNSKKTKEECAKLRTVNNLRNFDHVDTSPILSCYLDENVDENNNSTINNKRKRRYVDINNNQEESSNQKIVHTIATPATSLAAATKRLIIDSAENKENSLIQSPNESNLSLTTPKTASKHTSSGRRNKSTIPTATLMSSTLAFSTPTPANTTINKLDDTAKSEPALAAFNDETTTGNGEFRKVYFLRSSTARIKNMLNANNTATTLPVSTTRGSKLRNTTTATTISASITAHKLTNTGNNIALNKLNKIDSSTASSRSSSLTTTPSVRANDTSSSSHELNMDNLDHNNNNINHNKMFEDHQSKNGFNFI